MIKIITLEGRNTIHDALTSDKKINTVFIAKESVDDPKVQEIIKRSGYSYIPMNSDLSSLNVSVATALVVFEKLRQEKEV